MFGGSGELEVESGSLSLTRNLNFLDLLEDLFGTLQTFYGPGKALKKKLG